MRSRLAGAGRSSDGSRLRRRGARWMRNAVGIAAGATALLCLAGQPAMAAAAGCPNEAQRSEQGSTYLPECRAYEQVSPVEKGGSSITGGEDGDWAIAGQQGSSVLYGSYGTMPGGSDTILGASLYGSTREAAGWSIWSLDAPLTAGEEFAGGNGSVVGVSADLSKVVLVTAQALTSEPAAADGDQNIYLHSANGGFTLVSNQVPTGKGLLPIPPALDPPVFDGASADMSHVLFQTDVPLLPEASSTVFHNLYEWHNGHLTLADILPNGEVAPEGAYAGATSQFEPAVPFTNPVSEDGSRIFFVSGSQLYMRENGTTTVQVSAPESGGTEGSATFEYATPSGSAVTFLDSGKLTSTSNANGTDLYEYDVATGKLTDLSVDTNPADASAGAQVQGVVGLSKDGSYVYFSASGEIEPHPKNGMFAQIYLWHEGTISWVAPISSTRNWTPTEQDAFVSEDGTHLLLPSNTPLTSYENHSVQELYLYTAGAGTTECVSCNPNGTAPEAPAQAGEVRGFTVGQLYNWALPHPMAANGSEIFFETAEALVPGDGNKAEDVYEWAKGQVHLISSGTDPAGAYFGDASANGENVYFITHASLIPSDEDQSADLYDARVNGGIAPAPASLPKCWGVECREEAQAAPVFAQVASLSFEGAGNAAAAKATVAAIKVRVLGKSTAAVRLEVKVPAAGRLVAWGAGLRKVGRRVSGAGRVALRLRVSARAAKELRHGRKVKVKVHIRYMHAGALASAETLTLVLRGGKGR
jgi:hypothetical protein